MINRNSYRSLLESVQEAVAPATAGIAKGVVRKTRRSPASQSAPAAGQNLQWGDKAIGGAMNAMQLAQWLNSQSGGMAVSSGGSVTPSTSSSSGKAVRRTVRSKSSTTAGISEEEMKKIKVKKIKPILPPKDPNRNNPMKGPLAEEDYDYVLDQIIDELGELGEARLVSKIATRKLGKTMPSGKASASTAGGMGRQTTSSRPPTPPSSGPSGEKLSQYLNSMPMKGAKPVKEDEDFDLIDEILAEGLELYGEEELAEILADFEETGEISEELADLISETDSLWLSRSAEKKVAKKKA